MNFLLLIVGLSVFLFFYFVYPILRAKKISIKIQQTAVAFEQHSEYSTLKILIAGDSTGVGTGAGDSKYSVAGRMGKDFPNADITNISENGLKLEGLDRKLQSLASKTHYDLILLQIGANDVIGRTPLVTVTQLLSSVLKQSTDTSTQVIVVTAGNIGLAPVFRKPLSTLISVRTLAVRDVFVREIKKHVSVTYVDLFQEEESDIFLTDIDKYYAEDYFHPSGEGYGVWYRAIKKVLSF